MKNKLREILIKITGYFIYKKSDLPLGVDLAVDLSNKFSIYPKVVFDVGANTGQTSLHYSKLFPTSVIYAFEPFEKTFEQLKKNVVHLKHVQCVQKALGETNGEVEISVFDDTQSQLNSLKEVNSNMSPSALVEKIEVVRLDTFVRENSISVIDLLKIDTEGFEKEVLLGAEELLQQGRIKSILCEVALSTQNTRNTQLNELVVLMEGYHYQFVGLFETNATFYKEGLTYSNALFIHTR